MNFKNALEQQCFEIAHDVLGPSVQLEHNKRIQIERALFPEVAAFKGPPTKEIDVLVAELLDNPKVMLLVSCKEFTKRAEPAHVQEWAAVIRTMNGYSGGTLYLGMIVASQGFTAGCEAWATSHNLGLIPPLKGKRLSFSPETVNTMFRRSLAALYKRVRLKADDLTGAPAFFDFVYSLISDFEGHEEVAQDGRYFAFPRGWISSFAEMYSALAGRHVEDLIVTDDGATILRLSDGVSCRFTGSKIEFGQGVEPNPNRQIAPICSKNFEAEPCTLDFIRLLAIKLPVTSAADFGDYIEFGLGGKFNLGMRSRGFHIVSTANPIDTHRL